MMRAARVASMLALVVCAAAPARAQGQAADQKYFAEFTLGATLGHKSSGSVGAEGGYVLNRDWDAFVEVGRMFNVATSDLDARAQLIANAVGATQSASSKATYVDFGARYKPTTGWPVDPYVAAGIGFAHVRNETVLSVNGNAVPPESLGVQFGNDLNGSANKALLVIGFGVTKAFAQRYLYDLSYRYGRIFPKGGDIENDTGINTQRLQAAVGVRF